MATEQLYKTTQFFQTTLNVGGGINNSQTTGIIIASVSGIDITEPGIALLSYSDPLLTASCEWVSYTSINGSNELQGVTRAFDGYSAKAHANGVAVAFPLSRSHINNVVNALRTGWIGSQYTWVYASSTSFTIAGVDVTTIFSTGTKLRLKQGGAYKYYTVSSSSFSTDTTVNVSGDTVANAAITDNYYSYAVNPQGSTFSGTVQPSCLTYRSADQTISNNTDTAIDWDVDAFDTDTMHAAGGPNYSRMITTTAGKYLLTYKIGFAANGTGRRYVFIKKNGSNLGQSFNELSVIGSQIATITGSILVDASASDYFEVFVFQTSGGNLGVNGGTAHTGAFFAAHRVSA